MQFYDHLKLKDICSRKNFIYSDTDSIKKYDINDRIKYSLYGIYFEDYYNSLYDLSQSIYNWKNADYIKQKLNSIYGRKIFNKKENETMTNFQWLSSNEERVKEFINDADKLSMRDFYAKYGITDKYDSSISDTFEWLLKEKTLPKTECYDLYKLIKFVSNPALFSSEETTFILFNIVKLDNFRYHKGYGEFSVAVKRDNAIDVIFNSNLRANRKSLVTERLNALPVLKLDLTQASPMA